MVKTFKRITQVNFSNKVLLFLIGKCYNIKNE